MKKGNTVKKRKTKRRGGCWKGKRNQQNESELEIVGGARKERRKQYYSKRVENEKRFIEEYKVGKGFRKDSKSKILSFILKFIDFYSTFSYAVT